MKTLFSLAAAGTALLGLAGAESRAEPPRIGSPVGPPPMQVASKAYRCSDNSLFYIDFYSNNIAMLRIGRNGAPVRLISRGWGRPYSGAGYWISGNGDQIRVAVGRRRLLCRA
jgi:hypothetical protein